MLSRLITHQTSNTDAPWQPVPEVPGDPRAHEAGFRRQTHCGRARLRLTCYCDFVAVAICAHARPVAPESRIPAHSKAEPRKPFQKRTARGLWWVAWRGGSWGRGGCGCGQSWEPVKHSKKKRAAGLRVPRWVEPWPRLLAVLCRAWLVNASQKETARRPCSLGRENGRGLAACWAGLDSPPHVHQKFTGQADAACGMIPATMKKATPKKNWRGGARPGAGRPRVGDGKSHKVNTTLDHALLLGVKEFARENKLTIPAAIRFLINTGLTECRLKKEEKSS